MDRVEANKALVRGFVAALGALDDEKFLSFLAEDVVFETTGKHPGAGRKTKAQVAQELPAMHAMLPDGIRFTEVSMTGEGNRVVAELRGEAETVKGDRYDNEYCHIYEIEDGKITLFRDYMDSELVVRLMVPFFVEYGATAEARAQEGARA